MLSCTFSMFWTTVTSQTSSEKSGRTDIQSNRLLCLAQERDSQKRSRSLPCFHNPEKAGRTIAVEAGVQILTARWVFTQKTAVLCRARLVVCQALRAHFDAPTSSLDSLRVVLAFSVVERMSLLTADVSTAFMYAPVEADACDLVLLTRISL